MSQLCTCTEGFECLRHGLEFRRGLFLSFSFSDTPHYENVPFEVPESWVWTTLEEICLFLSRGKSPKYSDTDKTYPVFAQKCNLKEGGISLEQARFLDPSTICKWNEEYKLKTGDVLVNSTGTGTVGRTRLFHESYLKNYPFVVPDSHVSVIRTTSEVKSEFVFAYISSQLIQQHLEDNLAGSTNQKELYIGVLSDISFPLPPLTEQQRIVAEIKRWFSWIDQIEQGKVDLQETIKRTKSKILDLAIHGKLVPQDPNDEPAIELLKRINPGFTPCDNGHSEKFPNKWCYCSFKDIFIEITSKPYQILQSRIKGSGKYPVISQSANFIEGYSDENNVFQHKRPCIIFGDHTRNVKYIDFDFIVGADGVKILSSKVNEKWAYYLIVYASAHIENKGYSRHFSQIVKFSMMLPPLAEQQRIVSKIEKLFEQLDYIENSLEA